MKLNCVVTDDEPVAVEILEDYIRMVPDLTLVAKCKDAIETMSAFRQHDVDVLFIDIQMPEINGIEFVKSLKYPPAVIFTTAYTNYAHIGFELDALDYLLKPISVERFLKTVSKLQLYGTGNNRPEINNAATSGRKYIFIKVEQELVKIEFQNILYIEGLENYIRIHCENKTFVSYSTLKSIGEVLLPYNFLQIHRSYIVNIDKVDVIQNHTFKIKGVSIAVGASYKKAVSEFLKTDV